MIKNKHRKVAWLTVANEQYCEIFCDYGFDIICIDLEHSQISLSEATKLIRIINLRKKKSFIRLTNKKMSDLNRYLDVGIDGIIVPNVNSIDDLDQIKKNVYYPPNGSRGVGLSRANKFGDNFNIYFNKVSKKVELISIIESKEAIQNLDSILKYKYLDGIMIGPYDLSSSLGIPGRFDSPKFKKNIEIIEKKTKKTKKFLGIHVVEPDKKIIQEYLNKNYTFLIYSLDTILIKRALDNLLS